MGIEVQVQVGRRALSMEESVVSRAGNSSSSCIDSSRGQQTRGAVPVGREVGCKTDAATTA